MGEPGIESIDGGRGIAALEIALKVNFRALRGAWIFVQIKAPAVPG